MALRGALHMPIRFLAAHDDSRRARLPDVNFEVQTVVALASTNRPRRSPDALDDSETLFTGLLMYNISPRGQAGAARRRQARAAG